MKVVISCIGHKIDGYLSVTLNPTVGFTNVDAMVPAASAEEIIAEDVLDFFPLNKVEQTIDYLLSKLRHGGSITLSCRDIYTLNHLISRRDFDLLNINASLYGNGLTIKSVMSMDDILGLLTARGLKIVKKKNGWYQGYCCGRENMIEKGKLYFIIGLPRSGKGTYARQWAKQLSDVPRTVVNGDSIRLALTGERFNGFSEGMVNQLKLLQIKSNLINGFDVMVDGTHTTWKSIEELIYIDSEATFTFMDTDSFTCKERASKTSQEDLHPIIDRMNNQLRELKVDFISKLNDIREKERKQSAPRIQQ